MVPSALSRLKVSACGAGSVKAGGAGVGSAGPEVIPPPQADKTRDVINSAAIFFMDKPFYSVFYILFFYSDYSLEIHIQAQAPGTRGCVTPREPGRCIVIYR
jgi:hypothetical protein